MNKLLITLMTIFFATSSWASPAKNILEDLVSGIETTQDQFVDANEINAHDLSQSSLRGYLFRIQTLADMFSRKYPSLYQVKTTSKRYEDTIGAYREAVEKHNAAVNNNKPQDIIDKLMKKRESSLEYLTDFIKDRGWQDKSKIKEINDTLKAISWGTNLEDKNFAFQAIADRLTDLDNTHYDMFLLEDEGGQRGLHTFKKDLRWYRLEAGMLLREGLVKAVPQLVCTNGNCLDEDGVCQITSEHQSDLSSLYGVIGDVKDKGEQAHAVGEELEIEEHERAHDAYELVKTDKKIYSKLAKEFNSCVQ